MLHEKERAAFPTLKSKNLASAQVKALGYSCFGEKLVSHIDNLSSLLYFPAEITIAEISNTISPIP